MKLDSYQIEQVIAQQMKTIKFKRIRLFTLREAVRELKRDEQWLANQYNIVFDGICEDNYAKILARNTTNVATIVKKLKQLWNEVEYEKEFID